MRHVRKLKKNGCIFKILLFDRDSQVAKLRVLEECEGAETCINEGSIFCDSNCSHGDNEVGHDFVHQKGCINTTLTKLKDLKEELGDELMIRLVDKVNIRCNIIRVDDRMLVANYLCHLPGNDLPTMELFGNDTYLFKIFSEEFEKVWRVSKEWDWRNWRVK